nr:integral membrane protein duf6 [Colletotrichum truncatum]KAF6780994.1 integral membrane protein duf6 [Colletotrichum truncatum]
MPGEDALMELLNTTPSDSNSTVGLDFSFASPMPDNALPASPDGPGTRPKDCHKHSRSETTSPPNYDTLFSFNNDDNSSKPAVDVTEKTTNSTNAIDEIIHVDFAASNLYGLPNYIARDNKESRGAKMVKIVNGLKTALCGYRAMPPSKNALDVSRRFLENDVTVSLYCDACFKDCCPFLTREVVDQTIQKSREPNPDPLAIAFTESIVSIGYYAMCQRSRDDLTTEEVRDAPNRLASALVLYKTIQICPSSLLKLQAVISCIYDESLVWEKITGAVCCARDLRLVHAARGQQSNMSEQEQDLAQKSVWFLYSLETEYAIHHGMLPILDLGWGSRFPSFDCGDDMIAVSYTFSELLHSILKFQYSPRALNRSTSAFDRRDRLQASCHVLNEWVNGLPAPLNEAHNAKTLQGIQDDKQLRNALRVFCMYHKAVFFIHCPWFAPFAADDGDVSGVAAQMRDRCMDRSAESAFAVVKLANSGLFWEKGLERDIGSSSARWGDMGHLLVVSLCFIVYYLVNGEMRNLKAAMPYLAFCGGLFGRLSLENDEASLLDQYLELVQVIRST